jgi:hypothetical protein
MNGEAGVAVKARLPGGEEGKAGEDGYDRRADTDQHGGHAAGHARAGLGRGSPAARQVGEQRVQLPPGPRLHRPPRPLVEFVGGDPASLEVLAQLRDGAVAVVVRHAQIAGRVVPRDRVHNALLQGDVCL